jgi:hypothetical protein
LKQKFIEIDEELKEGGDERFSQILRIKRAIEIAKKMAGNYTGATKEIEKIAKGLSKEKDVKIALMRANEEKERQNESFVDNWAHILKIKVGDKVKFVDKGGAHFGKKGKVIRDHGDGSYSVEILFPSGRTLTPNNVKNKDIVKEEVLEEGLQLSNLVGQSIAHLEMYVELAEDVKKEYFKTKSQVSMFTKIKAEQVLKNVPKLIKELKKPGIWSEQVELDEANIVFKAKAKEGGYFLVLKRDTFGMSGSQDKFIMRHLKGNKVKELGSHPSLDGAKTFGKNKGIYEYIEESSEDQIIKRINTWRQMQKTKVVLFKSRLGGQAPYEIYQRDKLITRKHSLQAAIKYLQTDMEITREEVDLEEVNEGYEGPILAYLKKYTDKAYFSYRKLMVKKGSEGVVKTVLTRGVNDRSSLIYSYDLPPIVGVNEGTEDDKAYAIGMSKAKEIKKDSGTPLKKSTIEKGHEIAKAIKKNEAAEMMVERVINRIHQG